MSSAVIPPVAKTLYLCDGHIGFPNQKTDLIGLYNSIAASSYPYVKKNFVIFAQLVQGLGLVPFNVDIRHAASDQLVYASNVHHLNFPDRDKLVQLAYTVQGCTFAQAGIYLVELYCDGKWVGDTTLLAQ